MQLLLLLPPTPLLHPQPLLLPTQLQHRPLPLPKKRSSNCFGLATLSGVGKHNKKSQRKLAFFVGCGTVWSHHRRHPMCALAPHGAQRQRNSSVSSLTIFCAVAEPSG
jgi:hypothetical protein